MQLKEFIKSTLTQISEGILEAQKEMENSDMIINPSGLASNQKGDKFLNTKGQRYVQDIEINVGVTAIGIVTGLLSGGAQSSSENTNQTVSTIKLTIPVALPSTPTPEGHSNQGVSIR